MEKEQIILEMDEENRINLPNTSLEIPRRIYVDWNLSWFEKGLISEIIRLCRISAKSKTKRAIYCYPTNKYLTIALHKSRQQIMSTLAKLENEGYIKTYYDTSHTKRRIYIVNEKCFDRVEEYIK